MVKILLIQQVEGKRAAGAGREAGRHRGVLDAPFYVMAAEWPVLPARAALEQQRRRRVPHALERIVGRDQGDGPGALAADPRDDDGQDLAELGRDNQHALDVGFRRRDVQERDQLGAGQLVADEAVMGQLGQFLDPDPGVPEQLNAGPCPERVLFLFGQVPPFPGAAVLGPDPRAGIFQDGARQRLAASGELLTGRGGRCRRQPGRGLPASSLSAAAIRRGSTGRRSRVRWSVRDLRRLSACR